MIDSTDRNRFNMQPNLLSQMEGMRPQFDMGMDKFNQPTQVAPPMEMPAAPQMRSVLKRDQPSSEDNIRSLLERMKAIQNRDSLLPQR